MIQGNMVVFYYKSTHGGRKMNQQMTGTFIAQKRKEKT